MSAVASSLLAIKGCLIAICRGADSTFGGRNAVSSRTLTVLYRALHDLLAELVIPVGREGSLIAQQCCSIACHRGEIAVACDYIAGSGRQKARPGSLLAFKGAATAKSARALERSSIAAFGEEAIACYLIALGRSLIGVGRGLVAVGSRLVGISVGLILIGECLVVGERFRVNGDALRLGLDRPIRCSHRKIV
jgi:hypothetical protein